MGWLSDWEYRKSHVINPAAGAGTNYLVKIEVLYSIGLEAFNADAPSLNDVGYVTENVEYDSVTEKYWCIFTNVGTLAIRMASASNLDGPWTLEGSDVLSEVGHYLYSPSLHKFGDFWYIYYCRTDGAVGTEGDIWVQKSSTVNSGYSAVGISNPILTRGGGGTWDERRACEPYMFLEDGTYYLFYMGEDNSAQRWEKTGCATSSSPTSGFVKYGSNPILPADGYPHGWDNGYDCAADPFVFKHDGVYYVGVTALPTGKWLGRAQIGFYTSTDLVNFTHYTGNPVLSYGDDGNFDDYAVLRGAVTKFGSTYYLSYGGYDDDLGHRMGLTTLTIGEADNNEKVFLNEKCRTDFGDIRFTDDDGVTELEYWIESKVDSNYADIWVKISDDLSSEAVTIYIYYGKSDATTTSSDFTEDFTDYTEVDPATYLSQTALRATFTDVVKNISAYLYKNKGVGFFSGDFCHDFEIKITSATMYAYVFPWGVSNVLGDYNNFKGSPTNFIGSYYYFDGTHLSFTLRGAFNGESDVTDSWSGVATVNSIYYYTVKRKGNVVTCDIYSSKHDRFLEQSALDNLSITLGGIGSFQYIFTTQSFTGADLYPISGYVESFHLPNYIDPEPTHGTWSEEGEKPSAEGYIDGFVSIG